MAKPLRPALKVTLLLFSLVCVFPASAQIFPLADIEAYIQRGMKDWNVPGLAIGVVKEGQVILEKGYGVREIGKDGPVDKNTVFAIGSTSKAFTSLAVGLLVQDGRISWDDPVIKHMPAFQLYDSWVTREITPRDLLSNRSGLGDETEFLWYGTDHDRNEIVRRLRFAKPEASFRAKYAYRNVMFLTAGQIIPAVTGKSWDAFLEERIFKPLGMSRTFTSIKPLKGLDNLASPHLDMDGKLMVVPYRVMDNISPAGGINSSIGDMAKWLSLHINKGLHNGNRVVDPAVIQETHTQHTPSPITAEARSRFPTTQRVAYCLGWVTFDHAGNLVVWHNGSIDGMHAVIGFVPEKKIGAVVLSNSESQDFHEALFMYVLDRLLGNEPRDWSTLSLENSKKNKETKAKALKQLEETRVPGTRPALALDAYAGTYENEMYGEVRINSEQDRLILHVSTSLVANLEHWHYDSFRATWRDKIADTRMGKLLLTFSLDEKGKVARMDLDQMLHFRRVR